MQRSKRRSFSPARQARSRATLQRIFDAAERLMDEHSFEDISVAQIIRAAGVTVGSFYARFASKEALLDSLCERYHEDLRSTLREEDFRRHADATLAERVRLVVSRTIARCQRRRGLLRTLSLRYRLQPDWRGTVGRDTVAHTQKMVERFLRLSQDEIAHRDVRRAIRFAHFVISNTCRELLIFPQAPYSRSMRISDAALERELTGMVTGYLAGQGADVSESLAGQDGSDG